MAVTLPTFADVGIADPRSVGSLPTYPANDAVAEGTAALGAGIAKAGGAIEDVAAYQQMAQNRMERAMADADFTGRIIPLTEQLKKETDPEKITALRGQFQTALETSGNAIADPTARKLWQAQQSKHVATGQAEADLRNTDVYRDRYKAGTISQLDNLSRVGASASDPAAFDLAQSNIGNVTQSALASGAMTAVEATTYNKAATKQLVDGRARYLANNGDPEGARAFLSAHTADLDAITLQSLEAHIETKGDQTVALRAVNQALGRTPVQSGASPARPGDAVDRFLDLAEQHESGGKNIPQNVVGPNGGYNPSTGTVTGPSSAQGYFQIINPTWKAFAPKAGVDLGQYPNAMAAPYEVQRQVARTIATTDGVQHWTNFNSTLKAAAQAEGLPVSGPIEGAPQQATTDRPPTASLPGQGVLTRGQATLAALPDYLTARSSIMSNPSLNDRQRKLALDGLTSQFHQETTLYNAFDANAKRDLSDRQSANGAELLARGIAGEVVDPTQLSDWVRTQQITPEAFKTYQAELARKGKGTDDLSVFNDIDRRARAGEDVSQDILREVGAGHLKGTTGLSLQRAADARKQREGDQVERANFSTLRTLAGGDAVEKGLVSFGNEDHVRQIQLWTQAQREWNQRVLIGKEDSNAVLADMAPRYGHPVTDPKALPRPRMGAIEKPEDLPAVAQKTQAAHDAGAISEQQYREEQDLIVRYKAILDEQQQRAAAAAAAKAAAPAGSNAARGRVEMK